MYAFIRGKLVSSSATAATLDVNGIGFYILIPANLFTKMPPLGDEVQLFTSFIVREGFQGLYGFLSQSEKQLFEILLDVSGIGPKLALAIIGHLTPEELHQAIVDKEVVKICRVPGIGKKMAERLVIELQGKLSTLFEFDPSTYVVKRSKDPQSEKMKDALSALIHLGYNQMTAQKAIKKSLVELPESVELAALISHSLKHV